MRISKVEILIDPLISGSIAAENNQIIISNIPGGESQSHGVNPPTFSRS